MTMHMTSQSRAHKVVRVACKREKAKERFTRTHTSTTLFNQHHDDHEQRVLIGVIHQIGIKTIGDHSENRLPKWPTNWLKIQCATLGPPVVCLTIKSAAGAPKKEKVEWGWRHMRATY
jgi:hypothetical protein